MNNRGDYAASKGTRPVPLAVDPTQQALIHLQAPTGGSSALLTFNHSLGCSRESETLHGEICVTEALHFLDCDFFF